MSRPPQVAVIGKGTRDADHNRESLTHVVLPFREP